MAIEIRRARESDRSTIARLFTQNVDSENSLPADYKHFARENDKQVEEFTKRLERVVWDERCPWVIGESDGVVQGCMRISTAFMDELDRPVGVINDLIVAESSRRSGVGRNLIEWAIAHFEERKMIGVMLDVPEDNKVAVNFYLKAGFLTAKRTMVKFYI